MTTTAYKRFIILSNARTGSNLLQQALNAHPAAVCFRELFNLDPAYIDYDVEGWDPTSADDIALRSADIEGFLRRRVFCTHAVGVDAVGFKFHYDHFWFDQSLVPTLTGDTELHVLHLKRRNRLRTLVSFKIAEQTGEWLIHDPIRQRGVVIRRKLSIASAVHAAAHPVESVQRVRRFLQPVNKPAAAERQALTLTIDECNAFFYKVWHEEQHFGRLFEAHPVLELTYEDLVDRRDTILAETQRFLGLDAVSVTTTLRRQNPEPLSDLIANYDELRAAFSGTPEEAFFDD